jgi:hypothetical protein
MGGMSASVRSHAHSRALHPLEWARLDEAVRIRDAASEAFEAANAAWITAYREDGQHAGSTAVCRRRRMLALDAHERAEDDASRALEALQEARRAAHRERMRRASANYRQRKREGAGVG